MNSDDFNRLLITFLNGEPCLYDPISPFYNNINERHQAYLRIGQQLKENGASEVQVSRVNDRFQSLKRRFFCERRKIQAGSISTWTHYAQLEILLGNLSEKQARSNLSSEVSCSNQDQLNLDASENNKKRKIMDEDDNLTRSRPEFAGILDYISIKLEELDKATRENVIEKLLRVVHNPSICLVEDHQLPQNIPPPSNSTQWAVPPDQY